MTLLRSISRLFDALAWLVYALASLLMAALVVMAGWQVWGRYIMNNTPTWTEQATLLSLLYITLPLAAVGIRENFHLAVEILPDLLGPKALLWQERFVLLFDRSRSLSLNLFEHVHGESRARGQAMVDLRARYLDAGLEPEGNELPDYLPLFLDYCSTLPDAIARDTLAEPGVVLIALAARLSDKGSDYAPVLALLCEIAGLEMDEEAAKALPPAEDPETLEELDAQWEEEEIRFTADAAPDPTAACPQVSAILDRMRAPLPDAEPATSAKRS